MKKCPFCAEEIQEDAIKCKHCGSSIFKTDEQKTPDTPITSRKNSASGTWLPILKIAGIIILALVAIAAWYISIPAVIIWYIWKKTKFDDKKKIIVYVIVAVLTLILWSVLVYVNYKNTPTLTITEPAYNFSTQAKSTQIKGNFTPVTAKIKINNDDKNIQINNGVFTYEAALNDENNNFDIIVDNNGKTISESITINRILTAEEKAALEKANKERAANLEYISNVKQISNIITTSFSTLQLIGQESPATWSTNDLNTAMTMTDGIKKTYDTAKTIEPPEQFKEIHSIMLAGLKKYAQAMTFYESGIKNLDADQLMSSASLIRQGNDLINQAAAKMNELKDKLLTE